MITEDQITALAREYAEQTDGSPADTAYIKAIAENTLRFLCRRFCLVEKSKVEKAYREVQKQMAEGSALGLHVLFIHGKVKKDLLESLFPEIGKEVEG